MDNKKLRILSIVSTVFILIASFIICAFIFSSTTANAATKSNFNYSNYSGYEKYTEFEIGAGTAEPIYVVCYRSKAGSKYVSNGLVSVNGAAYSIQHVKGDEASVSYSTTTGDSLMIGGGAGGSIGTEVGGLFNKVGAEISVKLGYDHTSSSEKGSSLTFNIGANAPSGLYSIEECTIATEFIFDFYKATWKTVTETYKDGKSTKTREVQVHDSYEKNKYSKAQTWMSTPNAMVFYKLVKVV